MKTENIIFPAYRKYKNGRNFFKIIQPLLFEEIQVIGSKKIVKETEAKLLPERNFVYDLLFNYSDFAEEISEAEYESVKLK